MIHIVFDLCWAVRTLKSFRNGPLTRKWRSQGLLAKSACMGSSLSSFWHLEAGCGIALRKCGSGNPLRECGRKLAVLAPELQAAWATERAQVGRTDGLETGGDWEEFGAFSSLGS